MSTQYYGTTEEDFKSRLRGMWMPVTDEKFKVVENAIRGEVFLDSSCFSGIHVEPGTEVIAMMPVRIKF